MPLYQVYHSYQLTIEQRQSFADAITQLHCIAFGTPPFLVHVRYIKNDASYGTYFRAGQPRLDNSNSIVACVRTSTSRSKEDFDHVAAQVENAWNRIVGLDEADGNAAEKKMLMVTFTPMITLREGGMAIPEADSEDPLLKLELPHIR